MTTAGFAENLARCNRLNRHGFIEWAFLPGMLFGSGEKWWGAPGERDVTHEGLDFALYSDRRRRFRHLDPGSLVPAVAHGEVARILDDFLGQSVFVRHPEIVREGKTMYSIYGHLRPLPGIQEGAAVRQGDLIAEVAYVSPGNSIIPPHLHLSIAWISPHVRAEDMSWETLTDRQRSVLVDPVDLLGLGHEVIRQGDMPEDI